MRHCTHPCAAPRPAPCPRSFSTTNRASRKVMTRRVSSSSFAVLVALPDPNTYGRAQELPIAAVAGDAAGAVVVAGAGLAAGLGFGGGAGDALEAFIQAYLPVLRPAAWLATAFDIFLRTSSDMFFAVTPGPSAFFFFFFGPPSPSSVSPVAAPGAWAARAWLCYPKA